MLGICSSFPSTRSREEKGETEKDALEEKQNYDKCVMTQVLWEIGLAFSAKKDITLLDKSKTIFFANFFFAIFNSLIGFLHYMYTYLLSYLILTLK